MPNSRAETFAELTRITPYEFVELNRRIPGVQDSLDAVFAEVESAVARYESMKAARPPRRAATRKAEERAARAIRSLDEWAARVRTAVAEIRASAG